MNFKNIQRELWKSMNMFYQRTEKSSELCSSATIASEPQIAKSKQRVVNAITLEGLALFLFVCIWKGAALSSL